MIILVFLFLFFMNSPVFADRVLIRKSDGFPIEYQSGDTALGTLRANNPQYKDNEVEEKYITSEEYAVLSEEKIHGPARKAREDKLKQREDKRKQAEGKIKQKLGITESDWEDLKRALGD